MSSACEVLAGLQDYHRAVRRSVVTERNTDVGALISAGSSAGPAMFVIADVHKLRVSINVPQNYAPAIRIGDRASRSVPDYPARTFPAVVEASARAVDVGSGTTHMQLTSTTPTAPSCQAATPTCMPISPAFPVCSAFPSAR